MNPNGCNDLDYSSLGAAKTTSLLLKPLLLAQDIRTAPDILENLVLNSPFQVIRAEAAQNPSTPIAVYAKWLLNEEEGHSSKGREAKIEELSVRMDRALIKSGCFLADITKLPLLWKMRMLEAL